MIRVIVLILVVLIVSCKQDTQQAKTVTISASACAKRTVQGEVVDCEPTHRSEDQLARKMEEMTRIGEEYPGPKFPSLDNLYSVIRINNDGTITLQNGETLALAGVKCNHPDLIKYLRAMFLKPNHSKLGYLETGLNINTTKYAYIWEIDTEFGKDLGNGVIKIGPSVSSTNETALTSGWCNPVEQKGHNYHARYQHIANLAD